MTELGLSLAASLIAFLIGVGSRSALTWVRKRQPARKLWPYRSDRPVQIVMTKAPLSHDDELTTLTYPAEAVAASEVQGFLARYTGAEARLRMSDDFPTSKWDHDLVVIGGPVHNRVTRRLLEDLKEPAYFDGHAILVSPGERREARTNDEGEICRDVGLVVRRPNPHNAERTITLLMGSRTFGCLVAARAMMHENTRTTARLIDEERWFTLMADADIVDRQVQRINVVKVTESPRDARARAA